jgi:hypothetical protein
MEWQRRLDPPGERYGGGNPAKVIAGSTGPGEIETFSFIPLPSLRTVAIFAPTTYGQRRGPR